MTYSTNKHNRLNTARWQYQLGRAMVSYANRGYGDIKAAMRMMSRARAELLNAMVETKGALS